VAVSADISRLTAALKRDRVSGAAALARRAARILCAAARDDGKSLVRWQQDLRAVGEAIAGAQPAMGSLLTVVDLAGRAARPAATPAAGRRRVEAVLRDYLRQQPRALRRAAARVPALLPGRATCVTLSSSAGVLQALLAAARRGKLGHVVVAEGRPGREGTDLARRLAAGGVAVTVVVDGLAPSLVEESDAVVVGADAVTARAVWNKSGTFPLGLAARATGTPLLVVTTEDRLLPARLARQLALPEAEPAAVFARPPRGVRVLNRLFEVMPLRLATRVVTEAGAMTPAAVRRRLSPSTRAGRRG
jgi:translation initiation factor 2B subunit (eIF-2B alpha/beta/delta family)